MKIRLLFILFIGFVNTASGLDIVYGQPKLDISEENYWKHGIKYYAKEIEDVNYFTIEINESLLCKVREISVNEYQGDRLVNSKSFEKKYGSYIVTTSTKIKNEIIISCDTPSVFGGYLYYQLGGK